MRTVRVVLSRLAGTFRGRRAESELDEELAAHLEMEIEDHVRRGMSPADAGERRSCIRAA